ncbi:MAG: HPr family phosphocarrier protein [Lachnospiraceae bacterium]|nr:HPr family phosphocarrier protein [Lachnospiraceae bacterium]
MKTFSYTIKDELGIHARPAGLLVNEAKKYKCEIKIKKEEKEVILSRLLMLMGLAVKKDDEVTVTFDGEDEEEAYNAISTIFKEKL